MGYATTAEKLAPNYIPSTDAANIIGANTPEATRTSTSWGKMKEIEVITDINSEAILTFKLDMKSSLGGATAYCRARLNGTALGATQSEAGAAYVTKTWNVTFTTLKRGDLIQIYGYNDSAPRTVLCKNWYIYGRESPFYNTLES